MHYNIITVTVLLFPQTGSDMSWPSLDCNNEYLNRSKIYAKFWILDLQAWKMYVILPKYLSYMGT